MLAETVIIEAQPGAGLRARIARLLPALLLAASRCGSVAVQFVLQVVVGNLAGPVGLGLLQLFNSWTCIVGEVLAQGLPARIMRLVSVAWERGDGGLCRRHLRAAAARIGWACGCLVPFVVLGCGGAYLAGLYPAGQVAAAIALAVALAAPAFALLRVGAEALKAVDAPLLAVTLENLVAPGLILGVAVACWSLGIPLQQTILLAAGVAGFAVALLVTWRSVYRRLATVTTVASSVDETVSGGDLRALWANSVFSILFMQLPFLLLPWFADTAEIGIFAVAHKLVNAITMLLILMAALFGPAFARAAQHRDARQLGGLLWKTQYISTVIFLPLALLLLVAGEPLAGLFNLPAGSLQPFMLALAAGQLINALTGLPGVLLNMAGAANRELRTLLVSLVFAGALAPFVGQAWGALGVAWLFSASLALKNITSFALARNFIKQLEC